MTKEQIEKASIDYQLSIRPMCIGGDMFADEARRMNINPSFIAGANWALSHQWISVEDGLPKENRLVFVRINTPFGISYQADLIVNGIWNDSFNVTHWMPIPKLGGHDDD